MNESLKGKVALVTGGSAGIGLASARELSARGARVFVTGRRQAELDAAVALIGNGAAGIRADASTSSSPTPAAGTCFRSARSRKSTSIVSSRRM